MSSDFNGAKLAILTSDSIVTILRDDKPGIPWPGHWDLPGGAREGIETPQQCVLREVKEELGLTLSNDDLHYGVPAVSPKGKVWFFVTKHKEFDQNRVTFGNEGQTWKLAKLDWFLRQPRVIPHHIRELNRYFKAQLPPVSPG